MSGHEGFGLPLENYRDEALAAAEESENPFRVLDVGCGDFPYRSIVENYLNSIYDEAGVERGTEFHGLDEDQEVLEMADLEESSVYQAGEVFPYDDDYFDMVISNHLFCKLEEEEVMEVYRESERVLKE